MCRQDRQAGIVDVGEIQHGEIKPLVAGGLWQRLPHHLLIVEAGLIAMMPISDDRPAVGQHLLNFLIDETVH